MSFANPFPEVASAAGGCGALSLDVAAPLDLAAPHGFLPIQIPPQYLPASSIPPSSQNAGAPPTTATLPPFAPSPAPSPSHARRHSHSPADSPGTTVSMLLQGGGFGGNNPVSVRHSASRRTLQRTTEAADVVGGSVLAGGGTVLLSGGGNAGFGAAGGGGISEDGHAVNLLSTLCRRMDDAAQSSTHSQQILQKILETLQESVIVQNKILDSQLVATGYLQRIESYQKQISSDALIRSTPEITVVLKQVLAICPYIEFTSKSPIHTQLQRLFPALVNKTVSDALNNMRDQIKSNLNKEQNVVFDDPTYGPNGAPGLSDFCRRCWSMDPEAPILPSQVVYLKIYKEKKVPQRQRHGPVLIQDLKEFAEAVQARSTNGLPIAPWLVEVSRDEKMKDFAVFNHLDEAAVRFLRGLADAADASS